MGANIFGTLFSYCSFGESHGVAVGCVVDGCPARIPLTEGDIQPALDRRRPGSNSFVTPRKENDRVRIMSGIYQGQTTGHPILLLVENRNQRPGDYKPIHDAFRPGHADASYAYKYGIRDPRGGGRSSARETVARVAAGAVAKKFLSRFPETRDIRIEAGLIQLGDASAAAWDAAAVDANPFFCPDPDAVPAMTGQIEQALADGDSLGGVVEIRAIGVPPGLGEPVYDRLDGRIGQACLGLNAVRGVEIGDGFAASRQRGSQHNDAMRAASSGRLGDMLASNHSGGILGGISTGADIVVRCAFKPTPSIAASQQTVDKAGNDLNISVSGRHDPAVCIRAVPVLEATLWNILADFFLLRRAREH